MNWKQNKGFVIGAGVLGALLAGSAALVFVTASSRGSIRDELDAKVAERGVLESAKIHPSIENARRIGDENKQLTAFLATILDDVRARQPNPPAVSSPGDFNLKLESEQKVLLKLAAETKVSLPVLEGEEPQIVPVSLGPKFWFDFNEYGEGGKLPDPAAIPLLSVQLHALRDICTALVKAGVAEIREVEREKVESPAAPVAVDEEEGRAKAAPVARTLEKFTCSVSIVATEAVVWTALHALANHALPMVITGVEVQNQSRSLQPAFTSGAAGATQGPSLADQLRALGGASADNAKKRETAGTELVRVKVSLSVYRAAPAPAESQPNPPQGS